MDDDRLNEAAERIAEARLRGQSFNRLPDACRPRNEAEAYAIQTRLHEHLAAAGLGAPIGRKIGCTTEVMQRYLGIHSPCVGGLFAPMVQATPARFRHGDFRRVGVECEIAVRLGDDLPGRAGGHDRASVAEAIESCMAAIEIVDDRYRDYRTLDTPTLIADDFFNAGAVLGPAVSAWRSLDLAGLVGQMSVDGKVVGEGVGAAILGHPLEALAWLADAMCARGETLRAGEIVLLGSIVQTQWLEPGSTVEIAIDGLGAASVRFE